MRTQQAWAQEGVSRPAALSTRCYPARTNNASDQVRMYEVPRRCYLGLCVLGIGAGSGTCGFAQPAVRDPKSTRVWMRQAPRLSKRLLHPGRPAPRCGRHASSFVRLRVRIEGYSSAHQGSFLGMSGTRGAVFGSPARRLRAGDRLSQTFGQGTTSTGPSYDVSTKHVAT